MKRLFVLTFFFVCFQFQVGASSSSTVHKLYAVNSQARQCQWLNLGTEYADGRVSRCEMPANWEVLSGNCPSGYEDFPSSVVLVGDNCQTKPSQQDWTQSHNDWWQGIHNPGSGVVLQVTKKKDKTTNRLKTVGSIVTVENKQNEAAIKKIKKQRRLLLLAGAASAAAGAYLLHCQCNPTPATASDPSGGGKYGGECFKKGEDGAAPAASLLEMPAEQESLMSYLWPSSPYAFLFYAPPAAADPTILDIPGAAAAAEPVAGAEGAGEKAEALSSKINSVKLLGGPPGTTMGCWLGPLALGQAGIMLYKWHKLGKKQKKLSSELSSEQTDGLSLSAMGAANGKGVLLESRSKWAPPSSYDVPCLEDPTQTCQLVNSGTHITTLDGSPPIPLETVRQQQMAQMSPSEKTQMEEDLEEVLAEIEDMSDKIDELESNFNPVASLASNPFDLDTLPGTSSSDTGGNSGSEAFASLTPAPGEDDGATRDTLGGSPGNSPALDLPPSDLFGSDGGSSDGGTASYAGNSYRSSSRNPAENNQVNSLIFGDTKIAAANEDLFGVARGRYDDFRYRNEFVEPSNQGGTVWTPTLPGSGSQ